MVDYYQGLIHRFKKWLPVTDKTPIVTLNEGNTPLIRLEGLESNLLSSYQIYAKFEGANPTASFKDRGMTLAVSKAKEEGAKAIICASTGNTSASAAAYAARAGMSAFVIVPEGKIALGKLAQAMIHGAWVIQIAGNFDKGLELVRETADSLPATIVNSINPYRPLGQQTIAFEIIESLGDAPDYHFLPVGNAANIASSWLGYKNYHEAGLSKKLPVMVGFQAKGAAPFVEGAFIDNPDTIATAIRIGRPASWEKAHQASEESHGWFGAITDKEILAAQQMLAMQDGVFCEPASAAAVAGIIQEDKCGKLEPGSTIVCTLTGHGLKDADIAIENSPARKLMVNAEKKDVLSAMRKALEL